MAPEKREFKLLFFFFVEMCRVYLASANDNSSNIIMQNLSTCAEQKFKYVQYLQNISTKFCNTRHDGIYCWGPAPANSTQFMECPFLPNRTYIPWKDTINMKPHAFEYALRSCGEDGKWLTNKTDYSRCYPKIEYDPFKRHVDIIYIVGNIISFISLFLAVSIFVYFKKLMCLRNKIHCHFFLAISLRIITFFFHCAFEKANYKTTVSPLLCFFLKSMGHFSGLAKFLWMLAEGFYLVLVIVWTFGLERLQLWNFGLGAWGVPFVLTLIWLLVMNVRGSECNKHTTENWFIDGFIILSLVINLGIAIFIAKTLLTKLHDTQRLQRHVSRRSHAKEVHCTSARSTRPSYATEKPRSKERKRQLLAVASVHRKTMRSVLILFPLLGLTYIIFLLPPHPSFKRPWDVINAILSSTQGFFVALLFCFLNHEVQGAVRSAYRSWRDQRGFHRYAYGRSNSLFVEQNNIYRRQSSAPHQPKTHITLKRPSQV